LPPPVTLARGVSQWAALWRLIIIDKIIRQTIAQTTGAKSEWISMASLIERHDNSISAGRRNARLDPAGEATELDKRGEQARPVGIVFHSARPLIDEPRRSENRPGLIEE
jgi:hypothetical protein